MAASSADGASTSPDKPVLLHGDLDIHIIEARSLPNMDMFQEHMRRFFSPCRPIFQRNKPANRDSTRRQHHHKKIITSDPYVTVHIAGAIVARTRVITNSEDPKWDERFTVPLAHRTAAIEFFVKDNDLFGAELIGTVTVPPQMILSGEVDDWFPVIGANGKQYKIDTCLHLSMVFSPVEKNPIYYHGIAGDPEHKGVRDAYFPLRHGGDVTLYQDAHVKEGELPKIELENDRLFEHNACWEDICHAILEAYHLIYIVGWSIYDKVKLVREPSRPVPDECLHMSLGELLKYKSQEGVRICLLVWDDKTSHDKFFFKTRGMMQTHDEETRKFFKHSSVICQLSPRYASSKLSIFKQQVVGTLFTHHQKCVLVDTPASRNNRKITAFIGGLDLCDGRYDTPHHRLFQDLDTVFKEDLHQPTFHEEGKGPRQPWHDLHCKIEGPATYDILTNFEQRWRKATKLRDLFRRKSHWRDDALLKLERISWILSPGKGIPNDSPSLWASQEENPENWHVQIFRSIDSGSVKGFPSNVHEASQLNLVCEKNLVIDKSIHSAYVRAIRSAQHFIYIENQYFLGSSFQWNNWHSGAANLVPMELALKIVSKIRARERFSVYVLIPLWPEGVPTSDPVQEILFWQNQTMQMMYEIISQELKSNNIEDAHPTDYLNFYCLGNRENFAENNKNNSDLDNNNNGLAALAQKYGRFMIYVHSKGMIVDDEYVIMGSANINERSLSGSRDTEIAMGAYQPHYTWSAKNHQHPHGQVYGYRMSLWAEHMGMVHQRFKDPNSLKTVRLVNQIAETNWEKFTAEEICPLQGHLLKYPIKVEVDGKVLPLPNHKCFPDMGGQVFGEPKPIPDILTM